MGWPDWLRRLQGGKLRLGPMAPALQAGLSHCGPTALEVWNWDNWWRGSAGASPYQRMALQAGLSRGGPAALMRRGKGGNAEGGGLKAEGGGLKAEG